MKSYDEIKNRLENIPSPRVVENLLQISKIIYIIGIAGAFLSGTASIYLLISRLTSPYCIVIGVAFALLWLLLCRVISVLFDSLAVIVGSSWLSAQYIKEQTEYFLQNISDTNES